MKMFASTRTDEIDDLKMAVPTGSWWTRISPKKRIIFAIIALTIVLALALGLGLGLGLNGGSDNEQSTATPTPSALPTPPNNTQIWQPVVNSTWQIELLQPLDLNATSTSVTPDVDVFDIDLFNNSKDVVDALHRLGKRVICYFSAGSFEPNRPDSGDFQASDQGAGLDGWPGERWLNISSANVRSIMSKRLELASQRGCDAVDPDNTDGYVSNIQGFANSRMRTSNSLIVCRIITMALALQLPILLISSTSLPSRLDRSISLLD
jgi:hypothetical protein